MIRNSLIIAIRNFYRKPVFSLINLLGLAVGISCFVLTTVYINYELSYDNFHKNSGRVYIVTTTLGFSDFFMENELATGARLSEELRMNFPEVLTSARRAGPYSTVIHKGENMMRENVYAADSTFFDVLTYEFIEGSGDMALKEPNCMVVTESIAKKYFGSESAYGKTLNALNSDMKITGIIKDPPKNSVIGFDILVSLVSFEKSFYDDPEWMNSSFNTYVVLKKGIDKLQVEDKFSTLIKTKNPQIFGQDIESWLADGNRWEYNLYSLKEVHLDLQGTDIYLIGFGIVAVFLLVIACINYINLSVAKSVQRAKEVGVRKSIGAFRFNLVSQFLGESLFMSFLSLILGMGIVEAVLPFLSEFIGKNLNIYYFNNFVVLPVLIGFGLLIGIISGLYPALILSSYEPVKVLKGNISKKGKGLNFKNALILVQFTVSIVMIISLIIVVKQIDLLYNKNLGYNKNNLLILQNATRIQNQKEIFKAELNKIPAIENIAFTSKMPDHNPGTSTAWTPEGGKETTLLVVNMCDVDFLETMKIDLHNGRFFNQEYSTDSTAIVINQAAAKLLNWGEDALGRTLSKGGIEYHVIGVVKDYYFQTLHSEIKPLVLLLHGGKFRWSVRFVAIRLNPEVKPPIHQIEVVWKRFVTDTPFEYYFFDQQYKTYYNQEAQTRRLMLILTALILFVTALGLYGLASFTAQQKMKEIAIRKAMGASINLIVAKMTWSFTKLVLVANVIAWPLAWYFMNDWLSNFATRINISWWIFVLAALLSYLLAIATIIFQAFSAARRNPVEVLRYE